MSMRPDIDILSSSPWARTGSPVRGCGILLARARLQDARAVRAPGQAASAFAGWIVPSDDAGAPGASKYITVTISGVPSGDPRRAS